MLKKFTRIIEQPIFGFPHARQYLRIAAEILFGSKLQRHCRIAFKSRTAGDTQQGTYSIKQPSGAGGLHRIDAVPDHRRNNVILLRRTYFKLQGNIFAVTPVEFIHQSHRNAPAFFAGSVAASLRKIINVRQTFKAICPRQQYFAAPDRGIGAVTGTVHCHPDHRIGIAVFCHTS